MKWMLPILFIVYYAGTSYYAHIHIEDGLVILHSHPFTKSSEQKSHSHDTLEEIALFHNLSSLQVADGAVQTHHLDNDIQLVHTLLFSSLKNEIPIGELRAESLRAPPLL